MEYADHVKRLREEYDWIADMVAPMRGLGDVMALLKDRGLPLGEVQIINQDEYSLDFLIPMKPGFCLAFGIT